MKVYVKDKDKNPIIPSIIITIVMLTFSIGVFIFFIASKMPISDILDSFGFLIVLAVIFFVLGVILIYILLKKPKGYIVKLVNKKIEMYNGMQITYMEFNTEDHEEITEDEEETLEDEEEVLEDEEEISNADYLCYTIGENNLFIGKDYLLKIKEFNWEPKYIEEINYSYEQKKIKVNSKASNNSTSLIFHLIELIFGVLLLMCIVGIIMYPEDTYTYSIAATIFAFVLFATIKISIRKNKNTNVQSTNLELDKIKPLNTKQVKFGNITIKYLILSLLLAPIIWFLVLLRMQIEKGAFIIAFPFILFVELPLFIMFLHNIGYEKKLLKKHKINILENIDIANIKSFNIFIPDEKPKLSQYLIVDHNKNIILKLKNANYLGNKFVVCDYHDIKIGEIKLDFFSSNNEVVVNMVKENPFIIRSKKADYEVIGRNYYVKSNKQLKRYEICDAIENTIAYVPSISKYDTKLYELGNVEITINENPYNNADIMIIAFCLIINNI